MPAKHFIIPEKIRKKSRKLPKHLKKHLALVLVNLQENPLLGLKLQGELKDYYKIRLGDYRLIYRFDSKKSLVVVVKIEHRQGVYR